MSPERPIQSDDIVECHRRLQELVTEVSDSMDMIDRSVLESLQAVVDRFVDEIAECSASEELNKYPELFDRLLSSSEETLRATGRTDAVAVVEQIVQVGLDALDGKCSELSSSGVTQEDAPPVSDTEGPFVIGTEGD